MTFSGTFLSIGGGGGGNGASNGTSGVCNGIYLYNGATLTLQGTMTVSVLIAGEPSAHDAGVTVSSGSVTISGTNTYYGGTSFTGGTAIITADNNLGDSTGNLIFNGGTLQVGGSFSTSRTATLQAGGGTLSVPTGVDTYTYSGQITSTGALTKSGSGTLVLGSASNDYSGGTVLAGGTLKIGANANLGNTGGSVSTTSSSTLHITASIASMARTMPISSGQTLTIDTNTFDLANSGAVGTAATAGALTKISTGTLTLSGVNVLTGTTTISAGTLALSGSGSLASSAVAVTSTFDVSQVTTSTTCGPLSGAGGVSLGSKTLTVALGSSSSTYSGAAADGGIGGGTGGAFTVTGGSASNILTLTGTNTYTGATTITSGTLALSTAGSIATSSGVAANGTFDISQVTTSASIKPLSGSGSVALGSKTLNVALGASSSSFGGVMADSGIGGGSGGKFTLTGNNASSVQTFTGVNTYTGATTITSGTLALSGSGSLASSAVAVTSTFDVSQVTTSTTCGPLSGAGGVSLGSKTLTVALGSSSSTYSGAAADGGIGGGTGGAFTVTGGSASNILTLTGTNTYTGATTITSGTLALSTAGSIATSSGVAANGTFDISQVTTSATITALTGSGAIQLGAKELKVTSGSYSGTIVDNGIGGGTGGTLTKQNAGTLILTGANSYTGGTTVTGGTLQGNTTSLQGTISNAASLVWNQTADGTYSGTITGGAGAATVQGGGELTFSGSVTQDTVTIASDGVLAIDGTTTATTVTVNAGGNLLGIGTIAGPSTVNISGTLSAGHDVGALAIIGTVNHLVGSTYLEEIISNPLQLDVLNITGSMNIDSTVTFRLVPDMTSEAFAPNTHYLVIQTTGGVSGQFAEPVVVSLPSFSASLQYTPLPSLSGELLGEGLLGDPNPLYVYLLVHTSTPSNLPLIPSAHQIANCFDAIPNNSLQNYFLFMQLSQMEHSLLQMSPAMLSDLDLSQQTAITQVRESVSREMNLLLRKPCGKQDRFRFWSDVFVPRSSQHAKSGVPGYYAEDLGETVGFDYQTELNSFVGGFFSHVQNYLMWQNDQGHASVNNYYGGFYGGGWVFEDLLYAQGVIMASYDRYFTKRRIIFEGAQFSTFLRRPSAHFSGIDALGSFEMGRLWHGVVQNRLYGKVDYSMVRRQHFEEGHASLINLSVKPHLGGYLQFEIGNEIAPCFWMDRIRTTPHLTVGGVLQKQIQGQAQSAQFAGARCTMSPKGLLLERSLFFWEAGVLGQMKNDSIHVVGNFRGEYGSGYVAHNWSGALKFSF